MGRVLPKDILQENRGKDRLFEIQEHFEKKKHWWVYGTSDGVFGEKIKDEYRKIYAIKKKSLTPSKTNGYIRK